MGKRSILVTIPYPRISGNSAVRHTGKGRHYKQAGAKAYEALVLTALDKVGLVGRSLAGPLAAEFVLLPPDSRARDADNALKVVKDALTKARFWVDDSNRVVTSTAVEWGDPVPGGLIELRVTYEE